MATVADALLLMELIDNELQTDEGERQEARAIRALVQAQHYFETIAATLPRVLQTTINVVTTASQETTTWTSTLLRLDAIWFIDANGVPVQKLARIEEIGGHIPPLPWPLQIVTGVITTGVPFAYYANMENFYWLGRPDAARTMRIYGFIEQEEFEDRDSEIAYPDRLLMPFAVFATKLMKAGVEDDVLELDKIAAQVYAPVLRQLRKFDRSEPSARQYTEFHLT